MNSEIIMSLVTIVTTFVLGLIAKKVSWISNHLIPIQNLIIGIIMALVYYFMNQDISVSIALAGLLTGGTYDIIKNLNELIKIPNTTNIEQLKEPDADGSVG